MSERKEVDEKVYETRTIPVGLFSDPRVSLPTRVLLAYGSWGNLKDGGWCPLSLRTISAIVGVIDPGGFRAMSKEDVRVKLNIVRTARASLVKQGLLQGRKVDDCGKDEQQFRVTPAEPVESSLIEMNKIGRGMGHVYEAKEKEVDWSDIT